MKLDEFNVLYAIHKNQKGIDIEDISRLTGYDYVNVQEILSNLKNINWLEEYITESGYKALEKYRVDNAIIMAAGFGLRSLPLSRIVPKGLYKVKGEILIERQIKQLIEAGISEIIIVVGYLKEKFDYLREKYNVKLVYNEDYYRYNNISSIYAAKEYLKKSYICCSDNYFVKNVFEEYVYDSYYSCKYTDGYADEYCVTKMDGSYITEIIKGGSNAWYTIGEAYFSADFSEKFLYYLLKEYHEADTKKMLMDDFHIKHIDELKLRLVKYSDDIVKEFDTVEDVIEFDPQFVQYRDQILSDEAAKEKNLPMLFEKYDEIERYNSATTNQHTGRLHLNENSLGPSPKCLDVLKNVQIRDLYEYDMETKDFLVEELSKIYCIPADDIYIHNGSAEIIKSVFSIILERGDCVLISDPGWNYYASLAREKFCDIYYYNVLKDDYTYYFDVEDILNKAKKYRPKIIVINTPHNPTGCSLDGHIIEMIVKENPESLILLDEAYWGFSEENIDIRKLIESYTNILVSRTFSKYYGLANIRVGYGFCNAKVKHIFGLDLPLFRESTLSRRMAVTAIQDTDYYNKMNTQLNKTKIWFTDTLNHMSGIRAFQSDCNFVAVKIEHVNMKELKDILEKDGLLIRLFEDNGDAIARVTIADMDTMKKAVFAIQNYLTTIQK